MKKIFTLTNTIALAVFLLSSVTAGASVNGDDSSKCKNRKQCCKDRRSKVRAIVSLSELDRTLAEMDAELQALAVATTNEVKTAVYKGRRARIMAFASFGRSFATATAETVTVDQSQKIDFNNINAEMDAVQEQMSAAPDAGQHIDFTALEQEMDQEQARMSEMDASLKAEDYRNRKPAETILKTGIRS
ncbi:MAG TPA: hypothetical protein VF145_07265 [Chitinophagaceae bacterium]